MNFTTLESMKDITALLDNLGDRFLTVKIIDNSYFSQIAVNILHYKDFSRYSNMIIEAHGDGVIVVRNNEDNKTFDRHSENGLINCANYIKNIIETA